MFIFQLHLESHAWRIDLNPFAFIKDPIEKSWTSGRNLWKWQKAHLILFVEDRSE